MAEINISYTFSQVVQTPHGNLLSGRSQGDAPHPYPYLPGGFFITMIGSGLVMVPLALFILMPWESTTKAMVGTTIGVLYLLVSGVVLSLLLSEKRWLRLTVANGILRKLVE